MRRLSFLIAVTVLFHVSGALAWTQNTSVPESQALLDSLAKMKESRRAKEIEFLHTLLQRVKEQEHVSMQDSSSIDRTVGRLIEDKILGLTADGRRELVRKTIGQEDYSMLERVFLKQLDSSDASQRRSALRSLGYPLFVSNAADRIKAFVFHSDRMTQYLAVRSLVYLDVAGASGLLTDMIRSGVLMDYQLSEAVQTLYITNDKGLDNLAMALLETNPGGWTFKSLLPVLRKRPDYRDIVSRVFKSSMFDVPDQEGLPMEQQSKALAEYDLLEAIFSDPQSFMADEAIRKKVSMYASTKYNGLYTLALLTLEKSGQDIDFFAEMAKDSQLPAEKKQVLSLIIARIQKGERLK